MGLVCWLLSRMDMERARLVLSHARWPWLLAALVITCLIPPCSTLRWMGVLRAQENLNFGFASALRAVLMANVLNTFLPSKAGDGVKAFYLRKHGGLSRGLGTVIVERAVDLAVLGVLAVTGYFISGAVWGLIGGSLLLAGVTVIFAGALLLPVDRLPLPAKHLEKLRAMTNAFARWVRDPRAIIQTILGAALTWVFAGLTVCFLASALDTGLAWGYAYGVFPLAILAGLIPVAMSGVGTRDSAFVLLLSTKIPVEEATLIGLGYTVFGYWLLSLISLPAVAWEIRIFFRERRAERDAAQATKGTEAKGAAKGTGA
ncbi:MAG: hypothetical protein A3K19_20385 [Lentisphaerae bacterium RIFOXYB12_FULL_65_16]|nr:MAG: hypothetical protein A3K18_32735 [Lentisphaerae bacterium RIFOXYA12_64_32]OGV89320.1 MAG: hypothetical protein A3K19_20385 [Lentisphaerae bacterium RIFOXYB12_FULL_65_16]